MAPNGNGGLYGALQRNGLIMPFVKLLIHISLDLQKQRIMISLVNMLQRLIIVEKFSSYSQAHPKENVGVHILRNGKPHMIEYSEINPDMANLRDNEGNLVYDSANIVNIIFKVSYLEEIASAKKKELAQKYSIN